MKIDFINKVTNKDEFIVQPVFENDKNLRQYKNFEGSDSETLFLYSKKTLLLGLGEKKKFDARVAREIAATAIKAARSNKSATVTFQLIPELEKYGQEIGEGMTLADYTFAKYKTGKKAKEIEGKAIKLIRFVGKKPHGLQKGLQIGQSMNYVRDLVNGPANIVTPAFLANEARRTAKINGCKVTILDLKQITKLKMGLIMAVNSGSRTGDQQARFAILEYRGGKRNEKPIVLVGKGVIFDTGGLNIKPGKAIVDMHQDMAGGATVIGVFDLLKKLKIRKNVIGLIPITENSVDAHSLRPNDIITSYSGKTVEILNTDAEGRLVLADALWYGVKKYKPRCIINIATLTGACIVALGERYTGLFGNNEELIHALKKAGDETDDLVWHMPIHEHHRKTMESKIADLKNCEEGYLAASSTAAAFLENFVDETPWAHLDIAGTAFVKEPKKYESDKATGTTIRMLIRFLEGL